MPVYVTDIGPCDCCGDSGTGTGTGTGSGTGTSPGPCPTCNRLGTDNLSATIWDAGAGVGTAGTDVGTGSGEGNCNCLAGEHPLVWGDGAFPNCDSWESADLFGPCTNSGNPISARVGVRCVDNGNGTATLDISVFCSADNFGSTSVTLSAAALDALDVTVGVFMEWDQTPCGNCTWTWNDMTMSWFLTMDCAGSGSPTCRACVEPSFPGTSDGQTAQTPCVKKPADCCYGLINVRIMK